MSISSKQPETTPAWLSSKGLKNIPASDLQPNFTFIVGESLYHCPILVACFLSPRICQARAIDRTICEFEIKTPDPRHSFSNVLSLGRGEVVELTGAKLLFLHSVGVELGNCELMHCLFCTETNSMGRETPLCRLTGLSDSSCISEKDIEFVASHFSDFAVSDLDSLDIDVLSTILSSSNLILQSEDSLFETIRGLAANSKNENYFRLLEFVHFDLLSETGIASAAEWISECFDHLTKPIWEGLRNRLLQPLDGKVSPSANRHRMGAVSSDGNPKLDSTIIATFPSIFSMFRAHLFRLLYRGSRDGFGASDFHSHCDGHCPTLTVILAENGSVFGGYTPVAWHSRNAYISDTNVKSFLFTLKNPHDIEPRIFPLKPDQARYAIYGSSGCGPIFGSGYNLCLLDNCNTSASNYTTWFGSAYVNDTGLAGATFLTGSPTFTVREIEVFELIA
jgi:hypothetical protein